MRREGEDRVRAGQKRKGHRSRALASRSARCDLSFSTSDWRENGEGKKKTERKRKVKQEEEEEEEGN